METEFPRSGIFPPSGMHSGDLFAEFKSHSENMTNIKKDCP